MKTIFYAATATLLASLSTAKHEVTTAEATLGSQIVTHSFDEHQEALDYVGTTKSNSKIQGSEWGSESVFGHHRTCVLVSVGSSGDLYKVIIGPTSKNIYSVTTALAQHEFNHLLEAPMKMNSQPTTGRDRIFHYLYGMLDDDESDTIDAGEIPDEILLVLDTNQDGKINELDWPGLTAPVAFKLFDSNSDGNISVDELPGYMLDDIEKHDGNDKKNADQKVTLEEFSVMYNTVYKIKPLQEEM